MTTVTVPLSTLRTHAASRRSDAARWRVAEIEALYALPFMDLLFRAQQVHREHFDANEVQLSTLLSIPAARGACRRADRHGQSRSAAVRGT